MVKYLLFAVFLLTNSCATRIPMPAPTPCEVKVNGECRGQSASEKGGAVVRGHGEETKDIKP